MDSWTPPPSPPKHTVAFLALGTRGDIQPMLWVASQLSQTYKCKCVFATHADLGYQLANELATNLTNLIEFAMGPPATAGNATTANQEDRKELRQAEREFMIKACEGVDGVVFNLFAFEGLSIAEAAGIPAVAVSPFWQNERCPRSLVNAIDQELPELAAILKKQPIQGTPVRWPELDAWQWRLLLDDHGDWRYERLGLTPNFLLDSLDKTGELPEATPLICLVSPSLLTPHEISLLPSSVYVVGPCSSPARTLAMINGSHFPPSNRDANMLKIYVGFGSMEALGLVKLPVAEQFVAMVISAVDQLSNELRCTAVIILHSIMTDLYVLCKAASRLPSVFPRIRIEPLLGATDFDVLFPTCHVIIHHGGAGTVAAAARHAIPQIIIPFLFDQPEWAFRVTERKLGFALPPLEDLVEKQGSEQMLSVLRQALSLHQPTLLRIAEQIQEQSRTSLHAVVNIIGERFNLDKISF